MPEALSRHQALRELALGTTADHEDVKRAYRRLAREHHPDRGGDPDTFHRISRAFERLIDDDVRPSTPTVARGRPSRTVVAEPERVTADLASVDWATPPPAPGTRLDRDRLVAALTDGTHTSLTTVTATSRSPGSRLNRFAPHLAGHATALLTVGPDADDRGRAVVAVQVRAWARRARRALDIADLRGHWTRIRGPSNTLLRSTFAPADDHQASAVVATDRAEGLLVALGWGLPAWTLTDGTHDLA